MTRERHAFLRCGCSAARLGAAPRPFALPGSGRHFERDRPFLPRHLSLDLALDVERRSIEGRAALRFERVDPAARWLRLDAVGFALGPVTVESGEGPRPAEHVYDGETLSVAVPAQGPRDVVVEVHYRCTPRRGLYFLAPDEHVRDRPRQVWTQCQDEDARHWAPCVDRPNVKQTTELKVRVPPGWGALSNGRLVAHARGAGGDTFHWKTERPHAAYLLTLVAGEFAVLEAGEAEGVPVSYWVPKGRERDAELSLGETPKMLRHFAALTGTPFPWEKYAQAVVSDFVFGGMENTSATTLYEHALLDDRARLDNTAEDLVAHELAHQWFGDYVTCRDWQHGWLNEGFATFFEHLDRERRLGPDEYDYGLKADQENYLAEARGRYRRPLVCREYDAPVDLFDRHLYEKGGLVLHLLRRELGDEPFWRGVGEYLRRHAFGLVETRDLCRALEDASGKSLERFFEQWVERPGHPELSARVEHDPESALLLVHVKQTVAAGGAPFSLALELDVADGGGGPPRRECLRVERPEETFALPCRVRPAFVVVDPRHRILGELKAELPADLSRNQLAGAPTARGRWLAAQSLARHDDPATHEALRAALHHDGAFWGVRAEAAAALGALRSPEALAALCASTHLAHPKVRRAVAAALGAFQRPEAAEALRPLALGDESYSVEAEAARALGATRQPLAFDVLVELLDRPSWAELVRAGAIDGLAKLRDERAVPHLLLRTRYGQPPRARRAAARALAAFGPDRRTREVLEALLDDVDPHVRNDAAISLGELGDQHAQPALTRALDREGDARVRRRLREAHTELSSSSRPDLAPLRDELEGLRTELRELRARLAKLEARPQGR
ncbi:MAG TPA: M1 family aminopeptidase [Polyangiaceae bacterium]|nr:M1 family aminopeptidase [Polyangiaceae bacterium]